MQSLPAHLHLTFTSRKVDPPCCVSPETLDRLKKIIRERLLKTDGAFCHRPDPTSRTHHRAR